MADMAALNSHQLFKQWRSGDAEAGKAMAQRFSDWYYAITTARLGDENGRGPLERSCVSFQQGIKLQTFKQVEEHHRNVLGSFRRILDVTWARQNPNRTSASLSLLIEFEKATITGSFGFTRIQDTWKMTFFNLVLPLPRVPE